MSGDLNSKKSVDDIPMPNWSRLPIEVVQLILKKLQSIDLLRFKAVSSSFSLLHDSYISSPSYSPAPQLPWLMFASEQEDDPYSRCFFSLSEKKVYKLNNVLQGFDSGCIRCAGCCYGWLIVFDYRRGILSLLDPFSRAKIELPTLKTQNLVYQHSLDQVRRDDYFKSWMQTCRAILISDPRRTENFQVALLYGSFRLAFFRYGKTTSWTDLTRNVIETNYLDIAYYNGKLYALKGSAIEVWDFGSSNPFPIKVSTFELSLGLNFSNVMSVADPGTDFRIYQHLVASLGEIFYVFVLFFYRDSSRAYKIIVFKCNSSENRWEEQENLSGRSLFISNLQSMMVRARDFPECQENAIYFVDCDSEFGLYKLDVHHDVNVVGPPLFQRGSNNFMLPYWIVPNI